MSARRDRPDAEPLKRLAKFALLLANHVGDRQLLSQALERAAQRGR